jgi:hypothetical protein
VDCYPPFRLTKVAAELEDKQYHLSWIKGKPPGGEPLPPPGA